MKKEDFNTFIAEMQEKIGKENSSKIADDIGKLITDNSEMNKSLDAKDKEIEKLKQDKENLILANGNLLQQVSAGTEDPFQPKIKEKEEKKEPFSFKAQFDKNGEFID